MLVRIAMENDYEGIRRLASQVHELHVLNRPDVFNNVDSFQKDYFESLLKNENATILVADDDRQIMGFCIVIAKEPSRIPMMKSRRVACLESLCVDKEHRRAGIGKSLYNKALEMAKQQGFDTLELTVWSFNTKAIQFYEQMGMTPCSMKMEQRL